MSSDEGGHDAGGMMRWLLTYADMITLLMAFFIMMYSMSVISLDKFKDAASSLRAEFGSPTAKTVSGGAGILPHLSARTAVALPRLEEEVESVDERLQEYIEESNLRDFIHTERKQRGLVISLVSDNLLFPVGTAELRPPALVILDRIADLLRDLPNLIAIEGHTCNLPISTSRFPSNWELSASRACRVARYLVEQKKIPPIRIAATGYADSRPVASNATEPGRVRNRRVDIVVLSNLGPPDPEAAAEPRA